MMERRGKERITGEEERERGADRERERQA